MICDCRFDSAVKGPIGNRQLEIGNESGRGSTTISNRSALTVFASQRPRDLIPCTRFLKGETADKPGVSARNVRFVESTSDGNGLTTSR